MLKMRSMWATAPKRVWYGVAGSVMTVFLLQATFAVEAKPENVTIKSASEAVPIAVTHNGTPVPAGDISSVKLYVDNHDYDHMITVQKADGQVTIRPTEALELGHYDLAIKTKQGEVRVPVTALQGIADAGLEARAKRQGVSVDEIKKQLGISQSVRQERIDLGFSEVYYVGQTLNLSMAVKADRTAAWMVNGTPVDTPGGSLKYTFDQAGVYDFAYVEKEGDKAVALGLGTVSVVAEPAIPVEVKVGVAQTLLGPEGYGLYAWKLDGKDAGSDSSWTGTFTGPGKHTVSVRAEKPIQADSQPLRALTFAVTVP